MDLSKDFEILFNYAHYWNWLPDLDVAEKIYRTFPDSYSVLTPFMYSYLEEMIRTNTSEYGIVAFDKNNKRKEHRAVGLNLIKLAIEENNDNHELVDLLNEAKSFFKTSSEFDRGDNRNSVQHGYMHPRFWKQDNFENLIHFIAKFSPFAQF